MRQVIFSICLLFPGAVLWAGDSVQATDSVQLLLESERLFGEVQDLATELEIAREGEPREQLLVLVSLLPDERFQLQGVQLRIDDELVASHNYSAEDVAALAGGGSHRLLVENLTAGQHVLLASWTGKVPKGKSVVRDVRWTFRSGEIRRVVELELSQGKKQPAPQFLLREWN